MSMRCCQQRAETEPAFDNLRAKATSGSYLALRTDNSVVSYDNIEVARFKKYYAAGGVRACPEPCRRVAMWEPETVFFLLSDHPSASLRTGLGSTATVADGNGNETGKLLYKPWGETRYSSGSTPTSLRYTGQREDASIGLYFYNARYYDPALGRFIQADTIVPEPGDPQALNRYSYAQNNPLRYIDPSGHWTEEELPLILGKDWRERYFGKGAVFADRDKLLEFLVSEKTTNLVVLGLVGEMMQGAQGAHALGFDFSGVDALAGRLVASTSGGAFGAVSVDAILNLTSGEFSVFASPEAGFVLGVGAQVVGGIAALKGIPNNDAYPGTFMAVGLVGGYYLGANVEAFWGSPMADTFNAFDKAHGAFLGLGAAVDIGLYGSISYALEAYRYDAQGSQWAPYFFVSPLTVAADIGKSITHDLLMHPIWPWSPNR